MVVALLIAVTPSVEADQSMSSKPSAADYRAWALVIGAVLLFIVLGKWTGLVLASFSLAFVSALADRRNSMRTVIYVSLVVTAVAVVVFHYGLQMQFPLFVWG